MIKFLLRKTIRFGSVRVVDEAGNHEIIGDDSCPTITLCLSGRSRPIWKAIWPTLYLGEAYMAGRLKFHTGCIYDLLDLAGRNINRNGWPFWAVILRGISIRRSHRNSARKARRNAKHHYNLSADLFELFLDQDKQYSCAYFHSSEDDLDTAQNNKKRLIARKLMLRPGLRVLDIGSGWGGLALFLASEHGVDVTGLTLSDEQRAASAASAGLRGLSEKVRFELRDYRTETESYDRIVSIGMFEHVGKQNYRSFFRMLRNSLADDGVALIHSIAFFDCPAPIDPFVQKYIFTGADLPSLSEVIAAVESEGLVIGDIEILQPHYAETLRHWRKRFDARRAEALALYDERFCRMWEYYLAICEVGFRQRTNIVFQMQLTRRRDVLPWTRQYMCEDPLPSLDGCDIGKGGRRG